MLSDDELFVEAKRPLDEALEGWLDDEEGEDFEEDEEDEEDEEGTGSEALGTETDGEDVEKEYEDMLFEFSFDQLVAAWKPLTTLTSSAEYEGMKRRVVREVEGYLRPFIDGPIKNAAVLPINRPSMMKAADHEPSAGVVGGRSLREMLESAQADNIDRRAFVSLASDILSDSQRGMACIAASLSKVLNDQYRRIPELATLALPLWPFLIDSIDKDAVAALGVLFDLKFVRQQLITQSFTVRGDIASDFKFAERAYVSPLTALFNPMLWFVAEIRDETGAIPADRSIMCLPKEVFAGADDTHPDLIGGYDAWIAVASAAMRTPFTLPQPMKDDDTEAKVFTVTFSVEEPTPATAREYGEMYYADKAVIVPKGFAPNGAIQRGDSAINKLWRTAVSNFKRRKGQTAADLFESVAALIRPPTQSK